MRLSFFAAPIPALLGIFAEIEVDLKREILALVDRRLGEHKVHATSHDPKERLLSLDYLRQVSPSADENGVCLPSQTKPQTSRS